MLVGRVAVFCAVAVLTSASFVAAQQGGNDTVLLTWTAPGDDSLTNEASLYDVRYATSPITEESWNDAIRGAAFRPHAPPAGQPGGAVEVPAVEVEPADGAGAGVEIFVGAPRGGIDIPVVQSELGVARSVSQVARSSTGAGR